jgi:DNA adenine methylase
MYEIVNKSPLRYPGGKTRACKILDKIVNDYFDIKQFNILLSPFIGGGSFEFYMQNKYNLKIIANDKFTPLYNFWNKCKFNNNELCDKLYKINEISKEQFNEYRTMIMNETNDLLQAYYYFIINRCSFSGATLSGGFSKEASLKRFTKSSIDRIKQLNLSYFDFYNKDFEEFINANVTNTPNTLTTPNTLIFLDPPYYLEENSKLYGCNGDMHETFTHNKLYEIISTKKNWIMTYNNCDYIRTLYKDFIILDAEWSYGMNKSKQSSEIIILSF